MYSKTQVRTNGQRPLPPKAQGSGLVISTFQSHEFSFVIYLSEDEPEKVDIFRNNKLYQNGDTIVNILNDYKKK